MMRILMIVLAGVLLLCGCGNSEDKANVESSDSAWVNVSGITGEDSDKIMRASGLRLGVCSDHKGRIVQKGEFGGETGEMSLDQCRILACAQALGDMSKSLSAKTESCHEVKAVSDSKQASVQRLGKINLETVRMFGTMQVECRETMAHRDDEVEMKGMLKVSVGNRTLVDCAFGGTMDTYRMAASVEEGLTFDHFLELLRNNRLPVKVVSENVRVTGVPMKSKKQTAIEDMKARLSSKGGQYEICSIFIFDVPNNRVGE